jgi:O-antigen/teichoic acid export membrane protein
LGAKFIATKILGVQDAYLMLLTISPTLIFTSVSCALRGYYQGRQNMVPVAVSNVIEQFLNSVFTVVFAWLLIKYGLKYGVAGTTIGTFVGAVGAAGFLCYVFFTVTGKQRKKEVENTSPDVPEIPSRKIYREILKYSFPAILSTVAVCASPLIDSFNCITRLQAAHFSYKDATSLFGIYSYQYQRLFLLAISFSTALVTSMIPSISEALALRNHNLVRHRISESYRAIYLLTIPSIIGISFLAQPLITLVFYKRNSGAELVMLGTWTAIFMAIMYVQSGVLFARGKPLIPSITLIIGMVFKTLLNYVLIAIPSVNIFGAIIGTGVGGGMVLEGNLIRGVNRLAGAVGWFVLDPPSPGNQDVERSLGSWEARIAGPGIARRAKALLESGEMADSQLATSETEPNAAQVFAAARQGDPLACQIAAEEAEWLGMGIANIVSAVNPEIVILGGSVGANAEFLLPAVTETIKRYAQPFSGNSVQIVTSRLGTNAGLFGAAYGFLLRHQKT